MISRLVLNRMLVGLAAAGGSLLFVLGLLGEHAPRLDILAAFRWHAGALVVMAVVAALWPHRQITIALLSPVLILGLPIAMGLRPATGPTRPAVATKQAASSSGHALRVLSFNTWDSARNIDETHAMLGKADADVVILVEVSPPKRALLELLKPLYPHQVQCAAFWPCSMALLSRLPFEEQGIVFPSGTMPAAVWGRIAGDGGGLTVIGVHVHRPTRSPRIHLGHMQGVAVLARKARGAVVVAGDFNTPHWSASMRWLQRETGLRPMPRILPTWPAWPVPVPQFPIDHILVGGDVRLDDVATGPAAGSDHLPIIGMIVPSKPLRPVAPAPTPDPRAQVRKTL